MLEHLIEASNRYHRAVVRKVLNSVTSRNGKYDMVKVTFLLFTPGYVGEEVDRFYCIRAASKDASAWVIKDGVAGLAKLLCAASKPAETNPCTLVDSVVLIQLSSKPSKRGDTWITVADVKAAKPTAPVDNAPKDYLPF